MDVLAMLYNNAAIAMIEKQHSKHSEAGASDLESRVLCL
jgi:hypothetical protein